MPYLFLLVIAPWLSAQVNVELCVVTLRVNDVNGRSVPYAIKSFKNEEGVDFSDRFRELRGRVPCRVSGYQAVFQRQNVSAAVQEQTMLREHVSVSNPENWQTIAALHGGSIGADGTWKALTGSAGRSPGYVWRGRVLGGNGPLWVTFRSVIPSIAGPGTIESEVDKDGSFRAYGAFYVGPYILYVTNGQGNVLYVGAVRYEKRLPTERLEITIPSQSPSVKLIR